MNFFFLAALDLRTQEKAKKKKRTLKGTIAAETKGNIPNVSVHIEILSNFYRFDRFDCQANKSRSLGKNAHQQNVQNVIQVVLFVAL